ncbi:MAG TPA: peptidoglycan DD-metalloendopeptidase family protein [Spirochaetota bacterium]|nr:peptidoglycan DD-metalloendopeptidase family protein [Spirochaetota bacterium]
MALNPFKDSNLNDLQQNIRSFLSDHFDGLRERARTNWEQFVAKGNEKITLMVIPHSEKKIVNFHISIFAISFIVGVLTLVIIMTSVLIINHSSTIKEVSKLKNYGTNSKIQIKKYKEEINKLYSVFQKMKPELTHLYSLTPGSDIDSLWAKGGIENPNPGAEAETENGDPGSPPLEVLNIQEINTELETTKKILVKIKNFLEYRKKIIENTPSIWPVDGYVISRYGQRNSPYTFSREFHGGIDIEAFPGAEIKATAPGTIDDIRWDPSLGLNVTIKHKYGFVTSYSHCQRVSVEIGQKISKGEVIGYVGRSGKTNRYICYYQIRIGTEFVDPMPYLNRIIP